MLIIEALMTIATFLQNARFRAKILQKAPHFAVYFDENQHKLRL